jgi:hypothetical protein
MICITNNDSPKNFSCFNTVLLYFERNGQKLGHISYIFKIGIIVWNIPLSRTRLNIFLNKQIFSRNINLSEGQCCGSWMIPDHRSEFFPSRIPDPGSKRVEDPGSGSASASEKKNLSILTQKIVYKLSETIWDVNP